MPRWSEPPAPRRLPVAHRLRDGGRGEVVVVHPGALPVGIYARLASALPEGVGLSVLDLQGVPAYARAALAGGEVGDTTVERIADDLAGPLRRVLAGSAPDGDEEYVLVGWSFGGVVAHELVTTPVGVPTPRHLVLLDSISAADGYAATVEDLGEAVVLDWFEMYLGAKRPTDTVREGLPVSLQDVLDRGLRAGTLRAGTSLDGLAKAYGVFVDGLRRNTRLANPHRPGRTAVPATVVRADGSLLAEPGSLGYDRLVPDGAPVHRVPGDHYSMLDHPVAMDLVAAVCLRHLGLPTGESPRHALLETLP